MYDPITKEIVRNALINIADEMFWTSIRTAKSSIFYDTYDFSVALTDINGEILSIGIGVPGFIGIMDFTAKYTKEYCEREGISMDPGDVFVVNNPYVSGTHLNDVGVVMPIYVNNEMIGMAVAKGHINDVGGTNPGSWGGPASTEIYQEGGLIIPPVKLYRRGGERNRDVIDIIRFNSRIPDYAIGDLEALVAALRVGNKRIQELASKYGKEILKQIFKDILDDGEKLALAGIKKLPKGEFYAEDYLDDSGINEEPLKITARVKITEDDVTVDFSNNPPAVNAPINSPYPATVAAARIVFMALVAPHEPYNGGIARRFKVIAPEGTIFNPPKWPAPTSVYWETMTYAADLLWKALAPYVPDKLSAGHFLSVVAEIIAGVDPRKNEYVVLVEPNPGGWGGGHAEGDGESGLVAFADGETLASSVEILEQRYPIIVDQYTLNTIDGGAGPGRYRGGGFGIIKDYRIMADGFIFTTGINRAKFSPWGGLNGGCHGTLNYMVIIRNGKELMRVRKITNFPLKKGDVVRIVTAGGGGFGDPLDRDPKLVLNDVLNEYISIEDAKKYYGVIIKGGWPNYEVDYEATNKLREELRRQGKRDCVPLPTGIKAYYGVYRGGE